MKNLIFPSSKVSGIDTESYFGRLSGEQRNQDDGFDFLRTLQEKYSMHLGVLFLYLIEMENTGKSGQAMHEIIETRFSETYKMELSVLNYLKT